MALMMASMPPPMGGRYSGGGDPRDHMPPGRGPMSRGHPRGGGLDAMGGGGGGGRPGSEQKKDPRAVKAYVDLDAAGASSAAFEIDYRSPAY